MRHFAFSLLAASLLAGFTGLGQPAPRAELPHTFQLTGDVQVFSLRLIDAFPFIGGEVNGQKGQFMFDTGNSDNISLNEHLLRLPAGKPFGQSTVGSGQTYTRTLHDTIASIRLANGLAYSHVPNLEGDSFDFLEHITPDCIGQIGSQYFDGYLLKMDYSQRLLTCYRQTAARRASQDFLRGETVVAVLDIETRKRAGNVLAKLKIGGFDFLCSFDSGQQGTVYLSPPMRRALLAQKVLVPLPAQAGDTLCTLRQVDLGHGVKIDLHALYAQSHRNPRADKALGLTEPNLLMVGYAFLSQFTTIWDAQAHKMYLCAPQ